TRTIPIVFTSVSDPVVQGFVPSLMRPGGNITGFAMYEFSIAGKWLDLLKQMVPTLQHVAVVFNPETSAQSQHFLRAIRAVAPSVGVEVTTAPVHSTAEIEAAIAAVSRKPNGGLIFPTDSFTQVHAPLIAEVTARLRVPAIYGGHNYVESGGLMYLGAPRNLEKYTVPCNYLHPHPQGRQPGRPPGPPPNH